MFRAERRKNILLFFKLKKYCIYIDLTARIFNQTFLTAVFFSSNHDKISQILLSI